MDNKSMDADQTTWYSTYGLVTIERIFDLFGIKFNQADLHTVSRTSSSPYFQLLQVPLKNIFNGILISQTTDYREYTQKMLVNYLLSGAANLGPEETQLQGIRLEIDLLRNDLIEAGNQFDLVQFDHYKLINTCQAQLKELAKTLPHPPVLINEAKSNDFKQLIQPYLEQSAAIAQRIKGFRKQFYDAILKVREHLDNVPDYFNDFDPKLEHLEALNFNTKLGEATE